MEFVTTGEHPVFADEVIKKRGLIRATHVTWDEPRNGLIVYAGKEILRVLFLTGVNAAASYFLIKASDVAAGFWTILYSNDMEDVYLLRNSAASNLVTEVRRLFKEEEGTTNGDAG